MNAMAIAPSTEDPQAVPVLLWDWTAVLTATRIPKRTLQRELAAGRFPKPVRRVGNRPYWKPEDVRRWAAGGRNG
jgi:predicted DNA-binding transcriptional regulator AlpA